MIPCPICSGLPSPILYPNITPQQFLSYQRCDLKFCHWTNSTLFSAETQAVAFLSSRFFPCYGELNRDVEHKCWLLPTPAEIGSRPPARRQPQGAALMQSSLYHSREPQRLAAAANFSATLVLALQTRRRSGIPWPHCRSDTQAPEGWLHSALPSNHKLAISGKAPLLQVGGTDKTTFQMQMPWEPHWWLTEPKRSGLISLFAFSLLLATSQ